MKLVLKKSRKYYWFTLIELIVVILILSILYTISFTYYQNQVSKSRDSIRVSDIKQIANSIEIYSLQTKKYPLSDENLLIKWISNQWYFTKNISSLLKFNKLPIDPKDNNKYIYSTDIELQKYQLWTFLEENNQNFFTFKNINAETGNYENRFLYTYWNKIWIILDKNTNSPINSNYSTGEISLSDINKELIVHFTNSNTNSWIINWNWTQLKETIPLIQNSCTYLDKIIYNWENIIDKKIINNWTLNTKISCVNSKLIFWEKTIDCWEYVYDKNLKTCNENKCLWEIPLNTQINWTQKYNISWKYDKLAWDCNYVCKSWYFWNNEECKISDIWYYVNESWSESQKECNLTNNYQDKQWQDKCEIVLDWYYSTPEWNIPHTNQQKCEANYYCENWIKNICPEWTNSQEWAKNISECVANNYIVRFESNWWLTPSFTNKTVSHNNQIWTLPTVTRNGYNFNWWFTQISWWTKITTSTIINSEITYYAQWIEKINWVCWSSAWTCWVWTVSNFNNTTTPWAYKTWTCNWINWWNNASCSKQNSRTYSWATWWWWSCSSSCWNWTQYRSVYCRRYDWTTVSDWNCGWSKPTTSQWCSWATTCKRVKTWWGWEFACWHYLWTSCSPYLATMWAQSSWTTCLMTCK